MKFAMHKYVNTMNMSKKCQPICRFQYPKPSMKYTKILLLLNEEHRISIFYEITTQFLKKLIDMGLNFKLHLILSNLKINENIYLLTLQSTL